MSGEAATASSSSSTAAADGGDASALANRSILVDAAFFEEQFLRCQVCQERFDVTERPPKSLPCNHTFCVPCLSNIFDHAQPQSRRNMPWAEDSLDGPLKCPTCRVEIFVSKNKIKDLPNDHRVVQMIDFLSQAVSTTQNVCTKHERQPLNFFCKKCLLPICRDCTVLDHKEQQGHAIVDVKDALNDKSGDFNQTEEQCRQALQLMKSRSDALANASKRLDILERQLRNEIKETFIEYRLLLEKRQEALTHSLQQRVREQKALINTRFVHVCEHGTQLQKMFDSFSKAKSSNDVQQLFNLHKNIKEKESQFNVVAAADDNELFKSCAFESTAEGEFLSGISSLGAVNSKDDPGLKEPISAHQLLYLDSEDRRERQRLLQFALSGSRDHDMEDPDGDRDDIYVMDDVIGTQSSELSYRELQRLFAIQPVEVTESTGRRALRDEREQRNSAAPMVPRSRRRAPNSSSSAESHWASFSTPIAPTLLQESGDSRSNRPSSSSRSRRRAEEYRVERHGLFFEPDSLSD